MTYYDKDPDLHDPDEVPAMTMPLPPVRAGGGMGHGSVRDHIDRACATTWEHATRDIARLMMRVEEQAREIDRMAARIAELEAGE